MSRKRCFVLMPFTNEHNLNDFFRNTLRPFLENSDYHCERADISEDQNLDRRIIEGIYEADIIIADLTGLNCNVFYELGISHTIPIKTLIITQSRKNIPFDINKYNVVEYAPKNFNKNEFKKELNKILGISESNPVIDNKPSEPPEKPILKNFVINCLKDKHKSAPKKLIFIDLDGTLFNSYEHRTHTSQKAFKIIFENKKEEELKELYESIYSSHKIYEEITTKNFRYDWFTKEIYCITYLKEKGKTPKDYDEYLKYCYNNINSKALKAIEDAREVFKDEPIHPSPYAKQFLTGLKDLEFKLILVTEGEKEVQEWKLKQLGLDKFFQATHVGTPYENLLKLKEYIRNLKAKTSQISYTKNFNLIYEEYKKMHDEYKDNFHATLLGTAIKKFKSFQLAVIGDRYDIDLKPYEKINGKNILRIAVTQNSIYSNQTVTDIKELNSRKSTNVKIPKIVSDLSGALNLLIDPDTWKMLKPITAAPSIPKVPREPEEIGRIKEARDAISRKDLTDPFIHYADEILSYLNKR